MFLVDFPFPISPQLSKICENHMICQNAQIWCEISYFQGFWDFPEYEFLSFYETAFRTYYDLFVQTVHFSQKMEIGFELLCFRRLKTENSGI